MTELAFTKSFLSALDSRPIKLPPDYVFDPEQVGLRVPYILPRLPPPHPEMPQKITEPAAPGSSKSITIRLKSARNPVLEFSLPNIPLATTSVQDLKDAVRDRVVDIADSTKQIALEKIKILYKRKPVTGKTIAEILADEPEMMIGGKHVEFGVMVMGGAKVIDAWMTTAGATVDEAVKGEVVEILKPAVGAGWKEVIQTDAFWKDLQGFLEQRLKDEEEAKRLRQLFQSTWSSSR